MTKYSGVHKMQRGYPAWETVISQQLILLHLVCQSDVAKEHLVCNVETKDASGKTPSILLPIMMRTCWPASSNLDVVQYLKVSCWHKHHGASTVSEMWLIKSGAVSSD